MAPWRVSKADWTGGVLPALSHKPYDVGVNPASVTLTAEYANWKSGQVESRVIDCGFDSHLGYCNGPVVQRQRPLAYTQVTMVRVHPGSLIGLLVQQDDAGPARRN